MAYVKCPCHKIHSQHLLQAVPFSGALRLREWMEMQTDQHSQKCSFREAEAMGRWTSLNCYCLCSACSVNRVHHSLVLSNIHSQTLKIYFFSKFNGKRYIFFSMCTYNPLINVICAHQVITGCGILKFSEIWINETLEHRTFYSELFIYQNSAIFQRIWFFCLISLPHGPLKRYAFWPYRWIAEHIHSSPSTVKKKPI